MSNQTPLDQYLEENSGKLTRLVSGISILFASDCVLSRVITVTIGCRSRPVLDYVCFLREIEGTTGVTAEYMNELGDLVTAFTDGDATSPVVVLERLAALLGLEWRRRTRSSIEKVAVRSPGGVVTTVERPRTHRQALEQAHAQADRAHVDATIRSAGTLGYVLADGVFVDMETAYRIALLTLQFGSGLAGRADARLLSTDLG